MDLTLVFEQTVIVVITLQWHMSICLDHHVVLVFMRQAQQLICQASSGIVHCAYARPTRLPNYVQIIADGELKSDEPRLCMSCQR